MDGKIQRYTAGDRAAHWAVAFSFLLLVLTGLGFFVKKLSFLFALFGGGENALLIHKYAGIVFFIAGMRFFLTHWKATSTFDADDKAWLKVMGGYLNKKAEVPPMGMFNTGQKIFGITALAVALVSLATGLVLWTPASAPQGLAQVSFLVHSLCFVVLTNFFIAHLYLGVVGVDGSLGTMMHGRVSEAWAKKFAPKWHEELKKAGKI